MPHVAGVVDRGAAHVPEDAVALLGHEPLLLAGEGVGDAQGEVPLLFVCVWMEVVSKEGEGEVAEGLEGCVGLIKGG